MLHIGIVIIAKDRIENLGLLFNCLNQQLNSDFSIVLVDDGSVPSLVQVFSDVLIKGESLKIIRTKTHGCRSAARNLGAKHLSHHSTHILFLDSDIIFDQSYIMILYRWINKFEYIPIFGRVQWLTIDLTKLCFESTKIDTSKLLIQTKKIRPFRHKGTFVGNEIRDIPFINYSENAIPIPMEGNKCLFLNTIIPRSIFLESSGFDEDMKGYGYEDMEFGLRLVNDNNVHSCINSNDMIGFHLYHNRSEIDYHYDNQMNLKYTIIKYGNLCEGLFKGVDWNYLDFYTIMLGGVIYICDSQGIGLAINKKRSKQISFEILEFDNRLDREDFDVRFVSYNTINSFIQ